MRKYCVSAGPVQREIQKFCAEHGLTLAEACPYIGMDNSRIYKIMEQDQIEFVLADRILAKLGATLLWINDPVLSVEYQALDLFGLDAATPLHETGARETYGFIVEKTKELGSFTAVEKQLGITARSSRKAHRYFGLHSPAPQNAHKHKALAA